MVAKDSEVFHNNLIVRGPRVQVAMAIRLSSSNNVVISNYLTI